MCIVCNVQRHICSWRARRLRSSRRRESNFTLLLCASPCKYPCYSRHHVCTRTLRVISYSASLSEAREPHLSSFAPLSHSSFSSPL